MYKQSTTPKYWDCDCDDNYIHPKTEQVCKTCGADNSMADYPDSLIEEVIKFDLEKSPEIKPGEYTMLSIDPITHKNIRKKVTVVDTIRPDEDQNVAK